MSLFTEAYLADLLDRWAHEDFDELVDAVCPVDGNFVAIPVVEKVNIAKAWDAVKSGITSELVKPKREYYDGGLISADRAIREERLGTPIARFECIFETESEDHLEAAIEAMDCGWHMTFHDAVNAANVY